MNAVEISQPGGADVLRVVKRPKPVPGPSDVLIRVEAAGVSRADALQRRGLYAPPVDASDIPGLECAGTVAAIGSHVNSFALGDRVCALLSGGGYAQYAVAPVEQVMHVPRGWSSVEAATIPENLFTVYDNVVIRAGLCSGESILVHGGTSGIGSTALMLAKALHAGPIFATAGSAQKCAAAREFGADVAINYHEERFEDVVRERTEGSGVDVILDIVGGAYVARDLDAIGYDGRIVCIATSQGREVTLDLAKVLARRVSVLGSSLRPRSAAQKGVIRDALFRNVWPLLESRQIRPAVDSVFALADAPAAHVRLERSEHIGKIVLAVDSSAQ
ncbi:MAG: NAD(P)H-quinone oxidoreductase [Candidatus Eremiobacteraeota bacterium]|nr:NAD(P)H-quinone oxidoreductase [Candidatus Eremiobacteraeota bacterium]